MLLGCYLASLELAPATESELGRLCALRNLTPGDFSVVVRQHRFCPVRSAAAFVQALAQECALKAPVSPPIGFLG